MNYGDFPLEETIHVFFTTRAFATGIPGTLSAATVAVYEDITATPIQTSVAVTESLNSIAGLNAVPIVATAANGYEVGKNYHVVLEAGTVDSVSAVGEVLAYFSIGRSAAAVDLANATDGLGALKTLIDALNDPTVAAIADAVWDEILTGATHNIVTSAGRRLRGLQDFGAYEGGAVWIDTVGGAAGTTPFENGTVNNPVDSIADAKTIADDAEVNLKRFQIVAGSSITLAATFDSYAFSSDDCWTLALGGQSVDSTTFVNATVSGIFTGTPHLTNCIVNAITGPSARIGHSGLNSTITANAAGNWVIHDSRSEIAGATTPIFDFGTDVGVSSNVTFGGYVNGIEFRNFNNSGTDLLSIAGVGQVVYAASCSGTVNQRGDWRVTNTGGVTITADDNTRLLAGTVPQKNVALSNIEFLMVDATDFTTPETGLTVAGTRSIDGGAFGAVTGAIAEVANGVYQFDAAAADMNGGIITFRFTSAGAADRFLTIRTSG